MQSNNANVATVGHPSQGVVVQETTTTTSSTTHPHHHHPHHHHHGAAGAPVTATQPGPNNADGRALLADPAAPLGAPVILGGQCECTRNGGQCSHGAGKCMCRGCTAAATSLNPGVNIGMSTQQYTAPVGTTGLGGGVGEAGTGMAGVLNPTNTVGVPVVAAVQNCECVKNGGVCKCPEGQCGCNNCKAHRQSKASTMAGKPMAGSEYPMTTNAENYTVTDTRASQALPLGANLTNSSGGPITDNSNVEPKDYTTTGQTTVNQKQYLPGGTTQTTRTTNSGI